MVLPEDICHDSVPKPRRRLNRGGRSRLGCMTCRSKHVKCDERVPVCRRCERLGFRCRPARSSHEPAALPSPSSSCRAPLRPFETGLQDVLTRSEAEAPCDFPSEFTSLGDYDVVDLSPGVSPQPQCDLIASDQEALLDMNTSMSWESLNALATPPSLRPMVADCAWYLRVQSPSLPLSTDHIPLSCALVLDGEERHALRHFESAFATSQTPKDAPWSFPTLLLRKVSYSSTALHCALAVSLNDLDARSNSHIMPSMQRQALIKNHYTNGSVAIHDAITLSTPIDHVETLATFYFQYVYLSQRYIIDRQALDRLSQTMLQYIQMFSISECLTTAPAVTASRAVAPTPALRSFLCRLLFWIYKEDVYVSAYRCAGDVARYLHDQDNVVRDIWELSRSALISGWGSQYPAEQSLEDMYSSQIADMQVEVLQLRFDITELSRTRRLSTVHAGRSLKIERKMMFIEMKFAAVFHITTGSALPDNEAHRERTDSASAVVATYYAWKLSYHKCVGDSRNAITQVLSVLLGTVRRVTKNIGLRDLQCALLVPAIESKDPIHRDWILAKLSPFKRAALNAVVQWGGDEEIPEDIWEVHDLAFDRGLR